MQVRRCAEEPGALAEPGQTPGLVSPAPCRGGVVALLKVLWLRAVNVIA